MDSKDKILVSIAGIIAIILCAVLIQRNDTSTEHNLRDLGRSHDQYAEVSEYVISDVNDLIESDDKIDSELGEIYVPDEQ